jgi:DNA-binding IclR family transcriptional regulator
LNHINPKSMGKVDKETIKKQLKQARKQGYYVSTGKTEGIMAVSVPISHYLCPVALSVVGPEIRIKPVAANVVAEMSKSAKIIAEKLNKSDQK